MTLLNHLKFVHYYVVYQKFIKICISLLVLLGLHINAPDEDQFDNFLKDFLLEKTSRK